MPLADQNLEQALQLLGELLAARGQGNYDLVVCGGSALLAQNIVSRATNDVDVLAQLRIDREVSRAYPLPEELTKAAGEVAKELGLEANWLNSSASLHFPDFSALPNSFWTDLETHEYGDFFRVRFVARSGQILLKFYAALNRAKPRDLEDLRMLAPSEKETEAGLRWLMDSFPGLTNLHRLPELLNALNHDQLIPRIEK